MASKIIDVSSHNGTVNWTKAIQNGVKGAVLKIIRKDLNLDTRFMDNYKTCHKNKLPWGVYNYSYATTTSKAKSDMSHVCDILDGLDKTYFKMGVWFDLEDKCQASLSKKKIADIVNAAQKVVEDRGYSFGVYTGMSYYNEHIDPDKVNCTDWWIARYYNGSKTMDIASTPNAKYKPVRPSNLWGWQYTANGYIGSKVGSDNSNNFDINLIYRDLTKKAKESYLTVKRNSSKNKIKWLQKKLNENVLDIVYKNIPKLVVDGIWGSKTQAALEAYWKQLKWKKGTYAGIKTCKALSKNRK